MKIKVKSEGREGIYIPDKESLKAWITDKGLKEIHNFVNPQNGMFIGADHDVKSVLKDIDDADRIGILLEEAGSMNMGHSLSVIKDNHLDIFDIGKLTTDDLDITDGKR